jgi:hypothetical protein
MTSIELDTYFPFDAGPGADTGMRRWRKMAPLWLASGVVRGVSQEMNPNYWDVAAQVFHVGLGAVWVDGFYGEATVGKVVATPGNDGFVVAVLDPFLQQVRLEFAPGLHGDLDVHNSPDSYWHIPLFEIWPDGRWADRRRYVSPEPQVGLAEIPPWVPRGHLYTARGPEVQLDAVDGQQVIAWYLSWTPGWVAGRHIRASARCQVQAFFFTGDPAFTPWHVDLVVTMYPSGVEWARQRLIDFNTLRTTGGWTSLILPGAGDCSLAVHSYTPVPRTMRFVPNSCSIEVADVGV